MRGWAACTREEVGTPHADEAPRAARPHASKTQLAAKRSARLRDVRLADSLEHDRGDVVRDRLPLDRRKLPRPAPARRTRQDQLVSLAKHCVAAATVALC